MEQLKIRGWLRFFYIVWTKWFCIVSRRDLVQTQEYMVNWSHWKEIRREDDLMLFEVWTPVKPHSMQNNWSLYLLNVDFDSPIVVLIQGFEGTWITNQINTNTPGVCQSVIVITQMTLLTQKANSCYFRTGHAGLTAHGIKPNKATNIVVKIHVPIFIAVSANYHVEKLIIQGESWGTNQTSLCC